MRVDGALLVRVRFLGDFRAFHCTFSRVHPRAPWTPSPWTPSIPGGGGLPGRGGIHITNWQHSPKIGTRKIQWIEPFFDLKSCQLLVEILCLHISFVHLIHVALIIVYVAASSSTLSSSSSSSSKLHSSESFSYVGKKYLENKKNVMILTIHS